MILAAAAIAVVPEIIWGNSCGHDFDFHLVSWFDALNTWRHGIVYPHWTPSANYGAGEPRFVFYSPLTWMLGAGLAAVMPWAAVPVAMTFLLLTGTGLATRALAREALSDEASTIAGCIGVFSGYALFTAYERSAFAELAGGIWIPLVLKYALRESCEGGSGATYPIERGTGPWQRTRAIDGCIAPLAIAVAGSWLSNPTVGVMASYTLAAIALLTIVSVRSWWPVIRAGAGILLGLGLSAVYLVPAAWEQRWVDIHQVTEDPGQTLENNWLFAQHTAPSLALHDQVLHTASMIVVAMLALASAGILACWLRHRLPGPRHWLIPLSLIPAVVLLLQFSFSRPIWNLLPDLRFLQFPWRWLLVLEAPMAVFVAAAARPQRVESRWRRVAAWLVWGFIFIAVTFFAKKDFYQSCYQEDTVSSMLSVYRAGRGFEGTYEYEPIGADISLIPMNLPQACLVGDPLVELGKPNQDGDLVWDGGQGSCRAMFSRAANSNPEHIELSTSIAQPGFLILRLRSYPAWQLRVNGKIAGNLPRRADGLIAVPVPAGTSQVRADWTTTADVLLARSLSTLSILALTAICLLEQKLKHTRV